jgi:hypothetical protein
MRRRVFNGPRPSFGLVDGGRSAVRLDCGALVWFGKIAIVHLA